MLAAASAGQNREKRIVLPTAKLLFTIGQRQKQAHSRFVGCSIKSDNGLIQTTEKEMDLGPQERVATFSCSRLLNCP